MNNKLIISIGSLLVLVVMVFLIMKPLYASIRLVDEELVALSEEKQILEDAIGRMDELKEDYYALKKEAEKASISIPNEEELAHLIVQLESMAVSSGLLLGDLSFNQNTGEEDRGQRGEEKEKSRSVSGASELLISFKLNGSYYAVKDFLKNVENNIRLMDVSSVHMEPQKILNSESTLSQLLSTQVNIVTYYKK